MIGCASPDGVAFGEFRCLSADEQDERFNSVLGMYDAHCGLEAVFLTWTGNEYMYHMLRHNGADIPHEGLLILRLFTLYDWHKNGAYGILANEDDADVEPFVADFDETRRQARRALCGAKEMSDDECDALWNNYYFHIARKYGVDGLLMW